MSLYRGRGAVFKICPIQLGFQGKQETLRELQRPRFIKEKSISLAFSSYHLKMSLWAFLKTAGRPIIQTSLSGPCVLEKY